MEDEKITEKDGPQERPIMYHGTINGRVQSILSEGLRPDRGHLWLDSDDYVYLTGTLEVAETHASWTALWRDEKPMLFEVDVTGLDLEHYPFSPPEDDCWRFDGIIEKKRLKLLTY